MLDWAARMLFPRMARAIAAASEQGVSYNVQRLGRVDLARGERGVSTGAAELVSLCGQVAGIAATRIAQAAAKHDLKVYTDKRSAGPLSKLGARVVGRGERAYLMGSGQGQPAARSMAYAEQTQGEIIELTDHPIKRLLDHPAHPSIVTSSQLWAWWYLSLQIAGRAESRWIAEDTALVPMMPQHVWYVLDESVAGGVAGYKHGKTEREAGLVPADEVVPLRHTMAFDHLIPRGPLHNVLAEAALMFAHTTSERSRWDNGAQPDYIAKLPTTHSTDEQRAEVARMLREHFKGPANRGKPLITSDVTIEQLGFSPRDMEYESGVRVIETRTLAAFGYPDTFYRLADSNLASSMAARRQFAEQTIEPLVNTVCDQLTACLPPLFGLEPGDVWIGTDEIVPEDTESRRNADRQDVQAGVLTIAEYRARYHEHEAEPDNIDDARLLRIGGVPLAAATVPAAPAAPAFDLGGLFGPARSLIVPEHVRAVECGCERHAKRADLGPLDPDRAAIVNAARKYKSGIAKFYKFALTEGTTPEGLLTSEAIKLLDGTIRDITPDLMQLGGRLGLEGIGSDPETYRVPPNLLDDYTPTLTAQISLSYEDVIKPVIAEGTKAGLTTAEITAQLRDQAPDLADYAAERIARSETARATEAGAIDAWRGSGIQKKEWLLAAGACPICTTFYKNLKDKDRAIIPIGENYAEAGATWSYIDDRGKPRRWVQRIPVPGARIHPNNRSQVTAVVDTDDGRAACAAAMLRTLNALDTAWQR